MKFVPEWLRYLIWGPVYDWTPPPYRPVVCWLETPDPKREFEIGCLLMVHARHDNGYEVCKVTPDEFDRIVDQQPGYPIPVSRRSYKENEHNE